MNEFKDLKREYDNIEIPQELGDRVRAGIEQAESKREQRKKTFKLVSKKSLSVAAAVVVVVGMVATLNTNEAFAKTMAEIPVVGKIAQVLTVRSYEEKNNNQSVKVEVPEVAVDESQMDEGTKEFVGSVNEQIQQIVDEYLADAKTNYEEYEKAFLETGGTESELEERGFDVNVGYEIKYQDESYVSFVLTGYESCYNYTQKQVYYNLDIKKNKVLTLEDMLGENYKEIANKQIVESINKRIEENEDVFWGYADETELADEAFTSVDEQSNFYINEMGHPVVVFERYKYSPGYMGSPEFEILPE